MKKVCGIKWFAQSTVQQGDQKIVVYEKALALCELSRRVGSHAATVGKILKLNGILPKYHLGKTRRRFWGIDQLPEIKRAVETHLKPFRAAKKAITLNHLSRYFGVHHRRYGIIYAIIFPNQREVGREQ